MQKADVVFDALQSLGTKNLPLLRAYRLLFNPCTYFPHGGQDLTLLIQDLRAQRFRWGRNSDHDDLVHGALVRILTAYLSGRDGLYVHGLRSGTGIHTTLRAARAIAQNAQWLGVWHLRNLPALLPNRVDGLFFDTVKDKRFRDLLAHFLRFRPHPEEAPRRLITQSWLPAGLHGVCQHLTLRELDLHMADLASNTGTLSMPEGDGNRSSLRFVRYMNWILVAGNGSRDEALRWSREIKALVHCSAAVSTDDLASLQPVDRLRRSVAFLGYELTVTESGKVVLRLSDRQAAMIRRPFLALGKAASRGERTQLPDSEICKLFTQEFGAFDQFYALAENRRLLSSVQETLRSSMWRTLAHKHKCRVSTVARDQRLRSRGYSLIRKVGKTQFQVKWIDDVRWNDPKQTLVGEPCAVKVACTVRREA
jgi:hypothetical protein